MKKAREYFIEAISINNKNFKSYKNYIEITKIIEGDHIFKSLENISREDTNDQNKIDIFYSLSKGYFDQQKNKLGFQYLERGKNIKKKISNFKINRQKKIFSNIKVFFENYYSSEVDKNIKIKNMSIFILGMPRSGTTLIEQILSSHSKIHGAGELIYLPQIIDRVFTYDRSDFNDTINKIRYEYSREIKQIIK